MTREQLLFVSQYDKVTCNDPTQSDCEAFTDDISSWAAFAAARELADHWSDALYEHWKIDHLVTDLDRTIQILQAWRRQVVELVHEAAKR